MLDICNGFEWERKGTHEEHLSVIEYKKQERTKELEEIQETLAEKRGEFQTLTVRVNNLENAENADGEGSIDPRLAPTSETALRYAPGGFRSRRSPQNTLGVSKTALFLTTPVYGRSGHTAC